MFALRCTERLRPRRPKEMLATESAAPTTRLGDWYADLVHFGQRKFVLAVSERTFLPVIFPANPVSSRVPRLRDGLGEVLRALGVANADIEREVGEMADFANRRPERRRVAGVWIDFQKQLGVLLDREPSFIAMSLTLARKPCSALAKTTEPRPDRRTVALLARPPLRLVR